MTTEIMTAYDTKTGVQIAKSLTGELMFKHWFQTNNIWTKFDEMSDHAVKALGAEKLGNLPEDLRTEVGLKLIEIASIRSGAAPTAVALAVASAVDTGTVMLSSNSQVHTPIANALMGEINKGLAEIKNGVAEHEGQVQTIPMAKFIEQAAMLDTGAKLMGFKLIDQLGETTARSVLMGLEVHGSAIFEIHMPDGDKYEIVVRARKGDDVVRSFGYKL